MRSLFFFFNVYLRNSRRPMASHVHFAQPVSVRYDSLLAVSCFLLYILHGSFSLGLEVSSQGSSGFPGCALPWVSFSGCPRQARLFLGTLPPVGRMSRKCKSPFSIYRMISLSPFDGLHPCAATAINLCSNRVWFRIGGGGVGNSNFQLQEAELETLMR